MKDQHKKRLKNLKNLLNELIETSDELTYIKNNYFKNLPDIDHDPLPNIHNITSVNVDKHITQIFQIYNEDSSTSQAVTMSELLDDKPITPGPYQSDQVLNQDKFLRDFFSDNDDMCFIPFDRKRYEHQSVKPKVIESHDIQFSEIPELQASKKLDGTATPDILSIGSHNEFDDYTNELYAETVDKIIEFNNQQTSEYKFLCSCDNFICFKKEVPGTMLNLIRAKTLMVDITP